MSAKLFSGRYLAIAIPVIILQLVVFKLWYPFASHSFTDPFGYLFGAASNQDVGTWPVGYSKFLRVFNTFIQSDTGLVCFQYFLLHGCGLFFLSTVFDLFRPGRVVAVLLFMMMVFNPVFLWLANSLSAAALFTGLGLLWLTVLIGMIGGSPVYPVRQKILAVLLSLLLAGGLMRYTISTAGWQLANNALYAYGNTYKTSIERPPARYASLDSLVRQYFNALPMKKTLFDAADPGVCFLRDGRAPLLRYAVLFKKKELGNFYGGYGAWLIRKDPFAYLKYYLWPNAIRYAMPPMEDAAEYKSGMDRILLPYQFLHMAVNLFFGVMVWLFVTTKGIARASPGFSKCLVLMAAYWLVHLVFGILTAPVVFRNEVVVMIGCPVFSLLIMERLLAWEKYSPAEKTDHSNNSSHEEDKYDHRRLRILPDLSIRLRSDR